MLRPHDPSSGKEVEKQAVVKGYEYQRGQFVTFTPEELKALDVESSDVIDLEKFVARGEIDPVYFNSAFWNCAARFRSDNGDGARVLRATLTASSIVKR